MKKLIITITVLSFVALAQAVDTTTKTTEFRFMLIDFHSQLLRGLMDYLMKIIHDNGISFDGVRQEKFCDFISK